MILRKNKKTATRLTLFTLSLATGLAALAVVLTISFQKPTTPIDPNPVDTKTIVTPEVSIDDNRSYGMPSRLTISKIGVDASIQQVGLTASGDMEAPQTNEDTGWYKFGTRPGNIGSAVIAGHLGLDGDAVFGRLDQLVKGDTVSITDDQGKEVIFVVRESRKYGYNETPSEVFISTTGAHLNLITCDGDWEASKETFSDRLVVFTDKVD